MYATIVDDEVQDTSVITTTLLIHFALTIAMFDYGSTHIFIAKIFVNRIGVFVEDLGYELVVSTSINSVLTTRLCLRGVSIVIQ